jgi:hypothetical protein
MPISFRTFLPYGFGLLLAGGILAAKSPTESKQYDYVTVTQIGNNNLLVTTGPHKAEGFDVKQEGPRSSYNFTPLLSKVAEFEAQGYELVENQMSPNSTTAQLTNYVLMRKPK